MMLVCITCAMSGCGADVHEHASDGKEVNGVIFKGNTYKPGQRTSILIPDAGQQLEFGDGLALSFDIKIRHKGDHYGNICTVVVDNKAYVSLILTNTREVSPAICMVAADRPLTHIESLQESIYAWQRVNLRLARYGDEVIVSEGNTTLLSIPAPGSHADVRIFFGRSPIEGIQSIDVAPCELRDICLACTSADGKTRAYDFGMGKSPNDSILTSADGRMTARIINPVWIADTHSHWDLVRSLTFKGRVFPTYNAATGNLYLVTPDQVTRVNLTSNRTQSWKTRPQSMSGINNQFIATGDADNELLIFYDTDRSASDATVYFDFNRGEWERPLLTAHYLEYSHHNRVFDRRDSTVLRMFGYGHHRYNADIDRIDLRSSAMESASTHGDTIPPRYMAAVGMVDSLIYIYGGVGNMQGDQEYGTTVFNDLYLLNPADMEVTALWSFPANRHGLVPAQTIVIDETGTKANMLMYSPFSSETVLSLKELDITTGEFVDKADSIPYQFNDVKSWADLLMAPTGDELYAVTVSYNQDSENYDVKLYSIAMPILDAVIPAPTAATAVHTASKVIAGILIICVIAALGMLFYRRYAAKKTGDTGAEEPDTADLNDAGDDTAAKQPATAPGLYILNDFIAVGADGTRLTDQFSPILRQLLVLIAVYSMQRQNGISNSELKEFLWSDKSQESFVNNRSVNIRKIRMLLDKIGGLDILSSNGVWRLQASENSRVDFYDIMTVLDECDNATTISDALADKVVKYARLGPLFPYMQHFWLDSIKGRYSDRIISVLHRILDATTGKGDYRRQIMVCDVLLAFDSIDEKAVRDKCIALIRTKRIGMAHSAFKQFAREYETMMNEPWTGSFEQFIKN